MLNRLHPQEHHIDQDLDEEMEAYRAYRVHVLRTMREPPNPWLVVAAGTITGLSIGGIFTVILFHLY